MFQNFIPMSIKFGEFLSETTRERLQAEYDQYCAKYQELFGTDDEPCTATAPLLPSMLTVDGEAMSFGKRRLTFDEYVQWYMYRIAEYWAKHLSTPLIDPEAEKRIEWLSKKIMEAEPRPNTERGWESGPNTPLPYEALEWDETEQFNRGLFSQPVPVDFSIQSPLLNQLLMKDTTASMFHNRLLTDEPPQ